ncbi:MAG: hypothetical protein ACI4BD_03565 [Paludibacteraceae bacterium]
MEKSTPEIRQLRLDVESRLGRRVCTPADFDRLSLEVWDKTHATLSTSTLKRLWGYVDSGEAVHLNTLTLLAQYAGYADWEAYLAHLAAAGGTESDTFAGEGIRTSELLAGDRVLLAWLPNRRCVVRYEGGLRYVVEEQENSKLRAGDRFEAACFLVGQPMYLDNLVRENQPPTSYVAGSRHGLHRAEKL